MRITHPAALHLLCVACPTFTLQLSQWNSLIVVLEACGICVQGGTWSIPAVPRSHDASLQSARSARPAVSGRFSGGQAAPQQPDEHADWRNPSRSAFRLAVKFLMSEGYPRQCFRVHLACKARECCRVQINALPTTGAVVCRLDTEDTREGLARPARSLGREGLSFRPAERSSFTSSQPRHAVPLTEAEANHPFQQVSPYRDYPGH